MSEWETRPVEMETSTGDRRPGLELPEWRRVDGTDEYSQERTTVIASAGDDIVQVDIATERIAGVEDDRARLIEDILGDRVDEAMADEADAESGSADGSEEVAADG